MVNASALSWEARGGIGEGKEFVQRKGLTGDGARGQTPTRTSAAPVATRMSEPPVIHSPGKEEADLGQTLFFFIRPRGTRVSVDS